MAKAENDCTNRSAYARQCRIVAKTLGPGAGWNGDVIAYSSSNRTKSPFAPRKCVGHSSRALVRGGAAAAGVGILLPPSWPSRRRKRRWGAWAQQTQRTARTESPFEWREKRIQNIVNNTADWSWQFWAITATKLFILENRLTFFLFHYSNSTCRATTPSGAFAAPPEKWQKVAVIRGP
jgi:hypothetical protein